jgi:AraC-like DNA-binding protein
MRPAGIHHEEELGFRVWRVRGPGLMPSAHTHPDIELNFLFRPDRLRYLQGGKAHSFAGEKVLLFWGGIPHQTLAPSAVKAGVWITLPLAWFLQWDLPNSLAHRLLAGEIAVGPMIAGESAILDRWIDDDASHSPARRKALLLELQGRLERLALSLPRRKARPGRPVRPEGTGHIGPATRFIAEHFREPISLADIARAARLNAKYLARLFKKQCGITVWDYLTRLRVSHAQRQLITTNFKIVDVALESGFSSLAPFYAAFSSFSRGVRPLEYRRRHRLAPAAGTGRRRRPRSRISAS